MDVLHHTAPHRHLDRRDPALAALGLTLTFGQMGVINMAHGEFLMAGAYTAYLTQQVVTDADVSLLLAIPVAFARRRPARPARSRPA